MHNLSKGTDRANVDFTLNPLTHVISDTLGINLSSLKDKLTDGTFHKVNSRLEVLKVDEKQINSDLSFPCSSSLLLTCMNPSINDFQDTKDTL